MLLPLISKKKVTDPEEAAQIIMFRCENLILECYKKKDELEVIIKELVLLMKSLIEAGFKDEVEYIDTLFGAAFKPEPTLTRDDIRKLIFLHRVLRRRIKCRLLVDFYMGLYLS